MREILQIRCAKRAEESFDVLLRILAKSIRNPVTPPPPVKTSYITGLYGVRESPVKFFGVFGKTALRGNPGARARTCVRTSAHTATSRTDLV